MKDKEITDEDILFWREVIDKASPEPWYASPQNLKDTGTDLFCSLDCEGADYMGSLSEGWSYNNHSSDGMFIKVAREAMPRLLDEIQRLRSEK